MAKETTQRTLIAEYASYIGEDGEKQRHQAGTRLPFTATQLDRAIKAGVVHADDKLDADVPVNDPQGEIADESTGSGPAPDNQPRRGARKKAGERYSKTNVGK